MVNNGVHSALWIFIRNLTGLDSSALLYWFALESVMLRLGKYLTRTWKCLLWRRWPHWIMGTMRFVPWTHHFESETPTVVVSVRQCQEHSNQWAWNTSTLGRNLLLSESVRARMFLELAHVGSHLLPQLLRTALCFRWCIQTMLSCISCSLCRLVCVDVGVEGVVPRIGRHLS